MARVLGSLLEAVQVRTNLSPSYQNNISMTVGGTSVAMPLWAGVVKAAGGFSASASTSAELTKLYGDSRSYFNAVTSGSCGWYAGWFASSSWNFCTGLGSPRSYKGK